MPYCGKGSCFKDNVSGCMAEEPEPECYHPCGCDWREIYPCPTLASDPDYCDGMDDGPTGGDTLADTGGRVDTTNDDQTDADETADSTGLADADAGLDGTTDTGPTACMGDGDCMNPLQPFCDDGACVDCTSRADGDSACEDKDATAPVCDGDSGACVACTDENATACVGNTPVCDANECRGCLAHDECPDSACKIPMGVAPANTAWGECFSGPVVTVAATEIAAEVSGMGNELVINVTGSGVADVGVVVPDGAHLAILRGDGSPSWTHGMPGAQLTVGADASAWIDGVDFVDNNNADVEGIVVDGGELMLRQLAVVNNDGGGLRVQGNGRAHVENCFVGGSRNNLSAMRIDGGDAFVSYSTVTGGFGTARALSCSTRSRGGLWRPHEAHTLAA